jgi:hypothetical protein
MHKLEGTPGIGKSRIMLTLGKPKWMPLWLHRLRNRHRIINIKLSTWEQD